MWLGEFKNKNALSFVQPSNCQFVELINYSACVLYIEQKILHCIYSAETKPTDIF
jgi:hypothetical protein